MGNPLICIKRVPLQVIGKCGLCDNFKIYWWLNWKKFSPTCVSTSQMNFTVVRVPQSGMKTWCRLKHISCKISCMTNKFLLACVKTKLWWWQKWSKDIWCINKKSPFNTNLSWRELSCFKGLVRPNRTGDIYFFQKLQRVLYNSSFNTHPASFNKSTWRWTIARTKCGHKFAFCQVWNVEIWAWAASVFTV